MKRTFDDWLWIVAATCLVSGVAAQAVGQAWPQAPLFSWQGAWVFGSGIAAGALIYWESSRP